MLKTEVRNPKTTHIDQMSSLEMMKVIQEENLHAVHAVGHETEAIAQAVDAIAARMKQGGRLFYIGCGTSGRLGVLDASECPPTYGVSKDLVVGLIAGGDVALRNAVEGSEDNEEAGRRDLLSHSLTEKDSVVGISAAGGAPYVMGALKAAKELGAYTLAVTSNHPSPLTLCAEHFICTDTGAEVVTGSTRMKAGTAQKLVLNMISTAVMIHLGHVYENMMINLKPTNQKLKGRMVRIVKEMTGTDDNDALALLEQSGFVIRDAVAAFHKRSVSC